jgi:hypothetical protein
VTISAINRNFPGDPARAGVAREPATVAASAIAGEITSFAELQARILRSRVEPRRNPVPAPYESRRASSGKTPAAHVRLDIDAQARDLGVGQRAQQLRRRADDQRAIGKLLALGDHRARADQAVAADHRPVVDDRLDADERAVADRAAVQHRLVTDRHVRADRPSAAPDRRAARAVLDVRVVADADGVVVGANHGAGPHAHVLAERHAADHHRLRRDVGRGRDTRRVIAEPVDRHAASG